MHATGVEERRAHFLRSDFLAAEAFQSQRVFIERHRLVERADSDTEVIDGLDHGESDKWILVSDWFGGCADIAFCVPH